MIQSFCSGIYSSRSKVFYKKWLLANFGLLACNVTKVRFFIHRANFSKRYLFKYFLRNKTFGIVGKPRLCGILQWNILEKQSTKGEKMKMKISNFLSKIASAYEIWLQKFKSFLIMQIQFLFFGIAFLETWILKLYLHLPSNLVLPSNQILEKIPRVLMFFLLRQGIRKVQ